MENITLNNGIKCPVVGIGTFMLSPKDAENSVREALKMGYRLIDTANAYGAQGSWPFNVTAHLVKIDGEWYMTN